MSMVKTNFMKCARQYNEYTDATLSGTHGSTAQFWMMYVGYINIFHTLERDIWTNDIDLFIYTLTPSIDLFFATAHVNYSCWLTKYHFDLLNMDDTHPGLREILNNGCFTVRRPEHDFSRIPTDVALEQTINADAASRLTGITSFTNDYSARLRWTITKATRASFITLLQEMARLITKEDFTLELHLRRIQQDNEDYRRSSTTFATQTTHLIKTMLQRHYTTSPLERVPVKKFNKASLGYQQKGKPGKRNS